MVNKNIITALLIIVFIFFSVPEATMRTVPFAEQIKVVQIQVFVKEAVTHVAQATGDWLESFAKKMIEYAFDLLRVEIMRIEIREPVDAPSATP